MKREACYSTILYARDVYSIPVWYSILSKRPLYSRTVWYSMMSNWDSLLLTLSLLPGRVGVVQGCTGRHNAVYAVRKGSLRAFGRYARQERVYYAKLCACAPD